MTIDKENKEKNLAALGRLAIFGTTLIWGTSFVILKNTLESVPVMYTMAFRFTGAAIIMMLVKIRDLRKLDRDYLIGGGIMGLCLFAAYAFQTFGLEYSTPGKNAFLTATYVVMVPFLHWAISKARPNKWNVAAAVVCLAGMALISLRDDMSVGLGEALTACCGIFFALHILATFRYAKGRDTILINLVQFAVVAVLSWITAPITGPIPRNVPMGAVMSIVYLSVMCTAVCYFLQTFGQKRTPPSSVAVIMTLESVFGTAVSLIFYGEVISARVAVGFGLVFAALLLSETKLEFLTKRRERYGVGMEASIEIRKYAESDYSAFRDMFCEYFSKDFKIDITTEELENICSDITRDVGADIQFLDLLIQNGIPKGFILYQIDSHKSDWCEKEGYGFIREVFVEPELRKQGLGRSLVNRAEEKLYELTVPRIYLTSDESGDFWQAMGYRESGEVSAINNDPIFMK